MDTSGYGKWPSNEISFETSKSFDLLSKNWGERAEIPIVTNEKPINIRERKIADEFCNEKILIGIVL